MCQLYAGNNLNVVLSMPLSAQKKKRMWRMFPQSCWYFYDVWLNKSHPKIAFSKVLKVLARELVKFLFLLEQHSAKKSFVSLHMKRNIMVSTIIRTLLCETLEDRTARRQTSTNESFSRCRVKSYVKYFVCSCN